MAATGDGPPDDESWATEVAVQLADDAQIDESWPQNATGRHGRRPIARGERAVQAALEGLSTQISEIVGSITRQLDAADTATSGPNKLRAETVELTFGVTFQAGTGKVVEAILTAGGASSAQIKVVLGRGGEQ